MPREPVTSTGDSVQQGTPRCEHRRLRPGSGGYYVMCLDCPQTWVAKRVGAESDTDLDRGPPLTCTTPLMYEAGRWEWRGP